jgi:hypothetical protein
VNGWNTLIFDDLTQIKNAITEKPGAYIDNVYGDGHAAKEITTLISQNL